MLHNLKFFRFESWRFSKASRIRDLFKTLKFIDLLVLTAKSFQIL